jgi:hypothetical protein
VVFAVGLEGEGAEDIGPDRVLWVRDLRDDPKALAGVMDDSDGLSGGGGDGPSAAEKIQGVIGIESALDIKGQMEVQQRHGGHGTRFP